MRFTRNVLASALAAILLSTPVAIATHSQPHSSVSTPVVAAVKHRPASTVASRSRDRAPIDDVAMLRAMRRHGVQARLRHEREVAAARERRQAELREKRRLERIYSSSVAWARQPGAIAVANCESGPGPGAPRYDRYVGNPHLAGAHRGKWQFLISTYASVGGVGDPAYASEAEQDYRAWLLWKRDGWAPWECANYV